MKFTRPVYDARAYGANCDQCPMYKMGCNPITPNKNPAASLIQIGEYPEQLSNYLGKAFHGEEGAFYDEQMERLGIPKEEVHETYLLLCRPKRKLSAEEQKKAIKACLPRLEREIKETKTKTIHAMGAQTFRPFTGIAINKMEDWAGYPLDGVKVEYKESQRVKSTTKKGEEKERNRNVVVQEHDFTGYRILPNFSIYSVYHKSPQYKPVFTTWMNRAWDIAQGRWEDWVWPPIHIATNDETLSELRRIRTTARKVCVDIENVPGASIFTCLGVSDGVSGVSIPWDSYNAGKYGWVQGLDELAEWGSEAKRLMLEILADPAIEKVAHNLSHDRVELSGRGYRCENFYTDTILKHAVTSQQMRHGLKFAFAVEFRAERWGAWFKAGEKKGDDQWVKRPPEGLRMYNGKDSISGYMLDDRENAKLVAYGPDGQRFYDDFVAMNEFGIRSQDYGIKINQRARKRYRIQLLRAINGGGAKKHVGLMQQIEHIAAAFGLSGKWEDKKGRKYDGFNPDSNDQLRVLFFDKLNAPILEKSAETGDPSLGNKILQKYLLTDNKVLRKLCELIVELRAKRKLLSTYIENIPLDSAGIFHPKANVFKVISRRFSYSEYSPQVIPDHMRDLFMARDGMYYVGADFSQLEIAIAAAECEAPKMLDWIFKQRISFHDVNTRELFKSNEKDSKWKKQRKMSKGYWFGRAYGAGEKKIYETLKVEIEDLELKHITALTTALKRAHPKFFEWQDRLLEKARAELCIRSLIDGWPRFYWGEVKPTEVMNFPCQATGADIVIKCLKDLDTTVDWKTTAILLQSHDDILLETTDPVAAYTLLKEVMQQPFTFNGKQYEFLAEPYIGLDWKNKIEVRNVDEVIAAKEKLDFIRSKSVVK